MKNDTTDRDAAHDICNCGLTIEDPRPEWHSNDCPSYHAPAVKIPPDLSKLELAAFKFYDPEPRWRDEHEAENFARRAAAFVIAHAARQAEAVDGTTVECPHCDFITTLPIQDVEQWMYHATGKCNPEAAKPKQAVDVSAGKEALKKELGVPRLTAKDFNVRINARGDTPHSERAVDVCENSVCGCGHEMTSHDNDGLCENDNCDRKDCELTAVEVCGCGHTKDDHWCKDGGIEYYSECWHGQYIDGSRCSCKQFTPKHPSPDVPERGQIKPMQIVNTILAAVQDWLPEELKTPFVRYRQKELNDRLDTVVEEQIAEIEYRARASQLANTVQPQVEREWVSVAERLPETDGWYLVWSTYGYEPHYELAFWSHDAKWLKIIAWMPLPEPYQPLAKHSQQRGQRAEGKNEN